MDAPGTPESAASWRADPEALAKIDQHLLDWQQGDVASPGIVMHIARQELPVTAEANELADVDDEPGPLAVFVATESMAVVSQTCDVIRGCAERPFVKVSPVVRLRDQELADARARRLPRYAALPGLADDAFADLDYTTTLEKPVLVGLERTVGCNTSSSIKQFSAAVARHGGRFAFPDDVHSTLQPLRRRLTKRAGKDSPEGQCVDRILQIRASATPAWDDPGGYALRLDFILPVDELEAEPLDELDSDLAAWCQGKEPPGIAARLNNTPTSQMLDRQFLWMWLVDQWAALAIPTGQVVSVEAFVETEGTYTLWQVGTSEQLDLDSLTTSGS